MRPVRRFAGMRRRRVRKMHFYAARGVQLGNPRADGMDGKKDNKKDN